MGIVIFVGNLTYPTTVISTYVRVRQQVSTVVPIHDRDETGEREALVSTSALACMHQEIKG